MRPFARCAWATARARELAMGHDWPVRMPRPVLRRLAVDRAAGHRTADHRLPLSGRAGRKGRGAGRVRHRQDGIAGSAGERLQRRRHRLPGLRRTRQRARRRARGIPAAHRSEDRPTVDGTHRHHRQHVEHAGRGTRSVDLLCGHRGGIFSRPGPRRRPDGRLDEPLGGGVARGIRALRRTSRRRWLPRVSFVAARRFLRARGDRRDARRRTADR